MTTGPIVLKVGGAAAEDRATGAALWRAVASLHASEQGTGERGAGAGERGAGEIGKVERGAGVGGPPRGVVLVHGGGSAVDRHFHRLGLPTFRKEGIRLTPEDQIDEVVAVLAGKVNTMIVGQIQVAGAAAVGIRLGDGGGQTAIDGREEGWVPTRKSTRYAFDPGRVGEVIAAGDGGTDGGGGVAGRGGRLLKVLLHEGFLPVLSSIGIDRQGRALNINADDAAAGVARLIGARALVLMTDVPGVLDGQHRLIPRLGAAEIDGLIASGVIAGGMRVKVLAALETARGLARPVRIVSGNEPAALEALAAGRPAGTEIEPG